MRARISRAMANGELATRIQADDVRTKAALASAKDAARTARIVAIAGLLAGIAGLGVALAARASRKERT